MKRHESLVPLSRDHHFGLIMAQRLILGRATNPRADWPTDRAQQATRLVVPRASLPSRGGTIRAPAGSLRRTPGAPGATSTASGLVSRCPPPGNL